MGVSLFICVNFSLALKNLIKYKKPVLVIDAYINGKKVKAVVDTKFLSGSILEECFQRYRFTEDAVIDFTLTSAVNTMSNFLKKL